MNYNRGAQPNNVPVATIARSNAKDHVDLTPETDVNQNAQYVVDGRQLYTVSRAASVDRMPIKTTTRQVTTQHRQRQPQHPRYATSSHRTQAYVNGGYYGEPTTRKMVELQPSGYYVSNGGVVQVHAAPQTSARTSSSVPNRWRKRRSLPSNVVLQEDLRPLSRASSGHLTTMSARSNPDSLYLRWSPQSERRFTSDEVFLPQEADHLDNVSRSSYVIVDNQARAPRRSHQKPHKAFTLPPREESAEIGVSVHQT